MWIFIEPCFGIGHNLSLICQMTSEDIKHQLIIIISTRTVSRFGLAVGVRLVSGRTSVRYRFGSPFSSERLWFGTLSCDLSITCY